MAKNKPTWLVNIQQNWRKAMAVVLSLLIIWGMATFMWGSLAAWSKHLAMQQLNMAVGQASPQLSAWLKAPLAPLEAQLADPILQTLPTLPLGLASPAAQRWLDSQAYTPAFAELFMADFENGRALFLPGTTPAPPEVLGRLGVLQQTRRASPLVVASGTRNAMLYMAQPFAGAKGMMLVLPLSLRQLAPRAPYLEPSPTISLALLIPHASGGTATWRATEPMRLVLNPNLPLPTEALTVQHPLRGLPDLKLEAVWQGPLPGASPFVYYVIFLWALVMTMVVIWPYTQSVRAKVGQRIAPLTQPIQAWLNKFGQGPLAKVGHLYHTVHTKVGQVLQRLLKQTDKLFPAIGHKDPESWRRVGVDEQDAKPTEGLGEFRPTDVAQHTPPVGGAHSGTKVGLRPLNTKPTTPSYKPTEGQAEPQPEQDVLFGEEELSMQARVLSCLSEGLLDLLYQPIYRASDDTVFANEVLARLADDQGTITPGQFMPILSKAGKLADLDALVFERIMAVHYGNHRAASTKLSLNVSGNSLEDLTYLREVAQKGQDVLKHLIFEVRSNEVIRDPNALQLLKALQRQGAQIAIDYFGGGSGMVQATHALGLEYIKADAIRMADKPKKKDLLEMCMMAVELKVPVIMEKIEDKRSEDFARQAGVQFLQGYSLGKPTTTLNILSLPAKLKS